MSVVIDASVIVALLVADERQEAVQRHLQRWLESGEDLHAPAVLPFEVSNVLARLVFDGALEGADIADIWVPLRRSTQNHIGTLHAIAVCNGLEAAMGLLAEATVPPGMRWLPKAWRCSTWRRGART